jgi:hypothetical protein
MDEAQERGRGPWLQVLLPLGEFLWRVGLPLTFAIVLPLVVPTQATWQQLVIGLVSFCVGVLVALALDIKRISIRHDNEAAALQARVARAEEVRSIAEDLGEMARREPRNFFLETFRERVHLLREESRWCADNLELPLRPTRKDTRRLLQCVDGDICRFVHYLDNEDFITRDFHSKAFWVDLHEKVTSGKATVERLLVLTSDEELESEINRDLISVHLAEDGYSCKIIRTETYEELQRQEGLPGSRLDMGVYGDKYVYISEQIPDAPESSGSARATGTYYAGEKVNTYLRLFEACCDESASHEPQDLLRIDLPELKLRAFMQKYGRPD